MSARFAVRKLLGVGICVWVLALAIASERAAGEGPQWGITLQQRSDSVVADGVREDGVAGTRGLRSGYRVVAVDGVDPSTRVGRPLSDVTRLTFVDPGGTERTIQAPSVPVPVAVTFLIVAGLFVGLGAVVYRWAPDPRVGCVFLTFTASFGSALAVVHGAMMGYGWANFVAAGSAITAAAGLAAFFLWFPRPLPRARALTTGLAVGALGLLLANAIAFSRGEDPPLLRGLLWSWMLSNLLAGTLLLVGRAVRAADRRMLAPISVGVVAGVIPVVLLFMLLRIVGKQPLLPSEVAWIAGLGTIPLAFSYAILRQRLFALDALLRRVVLRGAIVVILAALFTSAWTVLYGLSGDATGAAVVASVLAAAGTPPLLTRVPQLVDRLLYPRVYRARAAGLAGEAGTPGAIASDAVARIRELVPTQWASLLVQTDAASSSPSWTLLAADGQPPPALARGRADGQPVLEASLAGATVIPIRGHGAAPLGLVAVGPRLDGAALEGIDREAIEVLAMGLADRLEAALLRDQAEDEAWFREGLSLLVRDLAAASGVEDVLWLTARHSKHLLGASHTAAWLCAPTGQFTLISRQAHAVDVAPSFDASALSTLRDLRVLRSSQATAADPTGPTLAYVLGEAGTIEALVVAARSEAVRPFIAQDENRAREIADHASGALRRAQLAARAAGAELQRAEAQHALQTARLRAEADALRELNRLKSEFISVASHELRTPMTTILGFSELAMTEAGEGHPLYQMLSLINGDAQTLSQLVDNLLDISAIENGRIMLELEPVDMVELVRPLLEAFGPQAPRHTLLADVAPEARWVQADPAKLHQILTNLLSNAIKYSPEGGRVLVATRRQPGTDRVSLAVSDEGIGIPAEHRDRVFDRFHRVDTSNTSGIRGTGLGLYIVRQLVELHGGAIRCDSEVGHGTTFSFELEASPAVPTSRPSHAPTSVPWLRLAS